MKAYSRKLQIRERWASYQSSSNKAIAQWCLKKELYKKYLSQVSSLSLLDLTKVQRPSFRKQKKKLQLIRISALQEVPATAVGKLPEEESREKLKQVLAFSAKKKLAAFYQWPPFSHIAYWLNHQKKYTCLWAAIVRDGCSSANHLPR